MGIEDYGNQRHKSRQANMIWVIDYLIPRNLVWKFILLTEKTQEEGYTKVGVVIERKDKFYIWNEDAKDHSMDDYS